MTSTRWSGCVDSVDAVISLGRAQRLFTGSARDAALLQAVWCTWTGCTIPAPRCQADHPLPWDTGGSTDPDNRAPACPRHNRHNNHGFTITRDHHGVWRTDRPDDTEIGMR